ncbi:MAG: ComEA family DNA-binding protein [Chloroflexota bacterium]
MPVIYSFTSQDTINNLLQAAGGTTAAADLGNLKFYVGEVGAGEPQRIDINRAEIWLLKALPGIGDTLAQRIVDYRQQNGPFRNTGELLKVAGISNNTYEEIKDKITVADW